MFACPQCRVTLYRVKNNYGVYWACRLCGGRAVTVALLRQTIAKDYVNSLWGAVRDGYGTQGRKCPGCGQTMLETGGTEVVTGPRVDVCRRCTFVWFDPREQESLPTAAAAPHATQLPPAAREALAMWRVKRMAEAQEMSAEKWKLVPALFGLPVERGQQMLCRWPVVTWSLAVTVALVSLWALDDVKHAAAAWGLIPDAAGRKGGLTFLTSFFVHGGLWHLVSNLYFLVTFGDNAEDYLGHGRYLVLLVAATVVGGLFHILGDPRGAVPLVGASGGISGVMTFYALMFPHVRLGFWWRVAWFQMPVRVAFGIWALLQFVGAAQQWAGFGEVSAWAHLGGALAGLGAWLAWKENGFWQRKGTA